MQSRKEFPVYSILEQRSDFFCAAKWTELYLYLNHGNSNSCHHPIPHSIPREMLDDPWVLHNTPHKLEMQQLMLDGHRPKECHMCWHVEDLDSNVVSDRIHKSQYWADEIANLSVDKKYIPKFIEVVFDNVCNLKCSYCDSGQSSQWATQVSKHPIKLVSDHRQLYSQLAIDKNFNSDPYFTAWLKWWPLIKDRVDIIKVSGGEPLISPRFWEFIDQIGLAPQLNLGINSNFSLRTDLIDKLVAVSDNFNTVTVSASIDAVGDIAEYTRQGLDFDLFQKNCLYWLENSHSNSKLLLQSTINIFSIWGFTDKLDLHLSLREKYPNKVLDFYSTLVRFPEFQSVQLLPQTLREKLSQDISSWYDQNKDKLSVTEKSYIEKTLVYLQNSAEPMELVDKEILRHDLSKFTSWYENSSGKKITEIYPKEFCDWLLLV